MPSRKPLRYGLKPLVAGFITNWLEPHFFENIALKKYRQALIDSYEELKIPFRQG